MSQHCLRALDDGRFAVLVGYSLHTDSLYALVFDHESPMRGEPVVNIKTRSLATISESIQPYATLPVSLIASLGDEIAGPKRVQSFSAATAKPHDVSVLHATRPTFSGDIPHQATDYVLVASMTIMHAYERDLHLCEELFRHTNSIDVPWFFLAEHFGLHVPMLESKPIRQRSTSVGDVVRVSGEMDARYYMCAPLGFEPIDSKLVHIVA